MDLPNITLFFQIGNFCIAYLILRTFIFAPVLNILVVEQSDIDALHKKIDGISTQQQHLLTQQRTAWALMKESLLKMIPSNPLPSCFIDKTLPVPIKMHEVKLSNEQKKSIRTMLQDELTDVKV
ncbi:MAG TPA: hypothetical protein VLG50_00785 [Candidatus Saccharimonadales bacterium]|nr:hypothetical protein [Candidatus Saccharimonadales bacterium]